ncbi:MAG: biopolymer transporter ExbD [Alphaproteobacteria bacterium]|nr:biopolymer transporter ExbD [Alphaproteobacteria bacterium]
MGRKKEADPELDLVPIMNMVTILIPFLLLSAQFVSIAVIDSTLPAIGKPQPTTEQQEEEEKLNLSVAITDKGFTILGASGVLGNPKGEGSTVPCVRDGCPGVESYDTKKLTELLGQIKDEYPDEENVILVPESSIPYDVLIAAMDATREDPETKVQEKARVLFPYVVIAGGVQ